MQNRNFYRLGRLEELKTNNFSLVPSRYIEFVDRDNNIDYDKVLTERLCVSELLSLQCENDVMLRNALKQLGYECKETKWVRLGEYIEQSDKRIPMVL